MQLHPCQLKDLGYKDEGELSLKQKATPFFPTQQ